jgi:CheY-like chemotaxis protein
VFPVKETTMPTSDCIAGAEPGAALKILVADDQDIVRAAMQGLLQRLGHAVEAVANGREAVEAAAQRSYDVVFLDVQMPELGGVEAAWLIRRGCEGGQTPRIVAISGDDDVEKWLAAAGMDEFLAKPVRLGDLIHVLRHSTECC